MNRFQLTLSVSVLILGIAFVGTSTPGWAQKPGHAPTMLAGRVTTGKLQYRRHCAPCHGLNGKGDGPVAPALTKKPANLTLLAKKNKGEFPEKMVEGYISGSQIVAAHGTREMPIWGYAFRRPKGGASGSEALTPQEVNERIKLLVKYIASIQEK